MKKLVLAAVAAVGLGGSAVANDYMYYGSGSGGLEGFFIGAGVTGNGSYGAGGEVNAGMNQSLNGNLMFGFEGIANFYHSGSSTMPGFQGQAKLGLPVGNDAWIYGTSGVGFADGDVYGLVGVGGEILINHNLSLFGQVAAVGMGSSSSHGVQFRAGFHWYPQN